MAEPTLVIKPLVGKIGEVIETIVEAIVANIGEAKGIILARASGCCCYPHKLQSDLNIALALFRDPVVVLVVDANRVEG